MYTYVTNLHVVHMCPRTESIIKKKKKEGKKKANVKYLCSMKQQNIFREYKKLKRGPQLRVGMQTVT